MIVVRITTPAERVVLRMPVLAIAIECYAARRVSGLPVIVTMPGDSAAILGGVLITLRGATGFLAECAGHLSRRGHRAIRVSRFGFLLRDRSAPRFVRRMPIAQIVERLFADSPGGIFRRRRTRIQRRMGFALFGLLTRRFPVADARIVALGLVRKRIKCVVCHIDIPLL